ncbi:MAG: hypothetical protein IKU37_04495 [Candidatus Gastranaerophilales bacterium]|nr:hypothetical protein [Candidatus Gastranaerophilales bacterium]
MGLDGISINQLRVTPENNSSELNNIARFNLGNELKIVDGLSNGQKVDPDRDKEKDGEDQQLADQYFDDEEQEEVIEDVITYDLSDSNKYMLKLDENSNTILIMEKSTLRIVQEISAEELSSYVGFLSNSQGSMINRKF